jgi:hypothetical protein
VILGRDKGHKLYSECQHMFSCIWPYKVTGTSITYVLFKRSTDLDSLHIQNSYKSCVQIKHYSKHVLATLRLVQATRCHCHSAGRLQPTLDMATCSSTVMVPSKEIFLAVPLKETRGHKVCGLKQRGRLQSVKYDVVLAGRNLPM